MEVKKGLRNIIILIIISIFVVGISSIDKISLKSSTVIMIFIVLGFSINIILLRGIKNIELYSFLFLMKFGLLIYDVANKNLPLTSGDFQVYHMFANDILENCNSILDVFSFSTGTDIYSKFNAIIYRLLENNYNIPYFFSFIFSLILSVYIFKTAMLITKDQNKSTNILLLWMITPLEIIYSITYLKESFIQMFFIISFYYLILYVGDGKKRNALIALILACCCSAIHSGMISIVIIYALFISFFRFKDKKIKISIKGILLISIVFLIVFMTPVGDALTTRFKGVNSSEDIINSIQLTGGSTSYISDTPESNIDLVIQTPYRFIMFAASPLPWQVNSPGTLISFCLDGVLQCFIILFYILFIFRYKPVDDKDKIYKELVIAIVFLTYLIYSWGTNTYGTAMRHRLKIYPMTLIIIYSYWPAVKESIIKRRIRSNETINKYNSSNIQCREILR